MKTETSNKIKANSKLEISRTLIGLSTIIAIRKATMQIIIGSQKTCNNLDNDHIDFGG